MAATVDVKATIYGHNEKVVIAEVTFDSSYPTGGEAIAPSDLGLHGITYGIAGSPDDASQRATWLQETLKLKLYVEDGTSGIEAEEGSTDDASAVRVPCIFVGV